MKRYVGLLALVLVLGNLFVSAQIRSNRDLLGKWRGQDMQVEFLSGSKVMLIVPGGKLPVAEYAADFTRNPISLNITLTDNGQKIVYTGTIAFIDNETIRLEYSGDEKAVDAFAPGRTVTLKKYK